MVATVSAQAEENKEEDNDLKKVEYGHVKLCLQAHVHNPITAFYYLLLKKKVIQGEPLDDLLPDLTNKALLMT